MKSLSFSRDVSKMLNSSIKILDCRSPCEYKEDHPPHAINTFVLNDSERELVGTLYKTDKFEAKKLGARLISQNIANILSNFDFPANQEFLLYCARGGQRSQSLAHVLDKIGYNVSVLEKGYKTYRNNVVEFLANLDMKPFTIYGKTGSGKTLLLQHLNNLGLQILDLEHCASHRGSILGSIPDLEKPCQKQFESNIYWNLVNLDLKKPIFIEGESKYVGRVSIPEKLWKIMQNSDKIYIDLENIEERIAYIRQEYSHFESDGSKEGFLDLLKILNKQHLGKLVDTRDFDGLVRELLVTHYDILYKKKPVDCQFTYKVQSISDLKRIAQEIQNNDQIMKGQ